MDNYSIVWLYDYKTYAFLIQQNAYDSLVRFTQGGNDYEVHVLNDDYEFFEDHSVDFEQD
jgi:hypothetical protein